MLSRGNAVNKTALLSYMQTNLPSLLVLYAFGRHCPCWATDGYSTNREHIMTDDVVGFRNIAVHDYQKLQLPITVVIIETRLDDFLQYSRTLLRHDNPPPVP
jgi:hypothetical protein